MIWRALNERSIAKRNFNDRRISARQAAGTVRLEFAIRGHHHPLSTYQITKTLESIIGTYERTFNKAVIFLIGFNLLGVQPVLRVIEHQIRHCAPKSIVTRREGVEHGAILVAGDALANLHVAVMP